MKKQGSGFQTLIYWGLIGFFLGGLIGCFIMYYYLEWNFLNTY